MKLSNPIEKQGFFWLPNAPKHKLSGVLRISESGKTELDVFCETQSNRLIVRTFDPFAQSSSRIPLIGAENKIRDRILGILEGGEGVTLDECRYGNYTLNFDGIFSRKLYPNLTILGAHYKEGEEVSFSRVVFSAEGLDEWFSISGFQEEIHPKRISVKYVAPEVTALNLFEDIELKFILCSSYRSTATEKTITQKTHISLTSKTLRSLDYFSSLVQKLRLFLCLAIDETVSIDSFTGFSSELKREDDSEIPIKVYQESSLDSEKIPSIGEMLFKYSDVEDRLEEILKQWIKYYDTAYLAFNLYFACRSGGYRYLEPKFLALVQAMETLHARVNSKKEKQLAKLIKGIIEPFKNLCGDRYIWRGFIDKIVDTRHYLIHADKDKAKRARGTDDLLKLSMKCEALLQLEFLRLIGVDFESLVKSRDSLRNKLDP